MDVIEDMNTATLKEVRTMTRKELYTAITAAGVALHPCNTADTAPADDTAIYYMSTEELTGIYADIAEEQTTETTDTEEEEEEQNMKQYSIKPEYYDLWGAWEGNDTVTEEQIRELSKEWEKPIDELMEQVEEIKEEETTMAPAEDAQVWDENGETVTPDTDTDTATEEEEEEKIMFTNYTEAVTEDAAQYIRDNYTAEEIAEKLTDRDEFAETLNDEMWIADEVTGNGSGSYTFDRAQAREYVMSDIDTVREALREFCTTADTIAEKFLDEDWEYFDVTARCYVLGQAIDAALDIIEAETKAA